MRSIIFAKTKKARIICAVLAVISLALAVFAVYYAVGNLLCAADSPILIGDHGGAVFLGYYLLASVYVALDVISLLACIVFAINAFKNR